MHEPFAHPMMARATHDELARQNFVSSFKIYMEDDVYPENEAVYRKRAEPRFVREHNRPPANRHEVRRALETEAFTQTWSSIARTLQEMMWDASGETVERQLPELIAKAKVRNPRGSLRLDPNLKVPKYNAAIDIHCMPGGYATELCEDDVFSGALVDRGGYYYALPLQGKAAHAFRDTAENSYRGAAARNVIRYLHREFPSLAPRRILDMGCGIGGGTLPYVDAYPDAKVYGIDLGGPQVRYGHARAEGLGKTVHFSQQNAERTNFPDGHFDLIVSHGLAHETSTKAIRLIMAEVSRLLAAGGVTVHSDPQMGRGLTPHDSFMHDWDTHNNNEPFWGTLHDIGVADLMTGAGFAPDSVHDVWARYGDDDGPSIIAADDVTSSLARTSIFGAQK